MHLFLIILRYVGCGIYGFGIPIAWMLCEKEKRYHPRADRWMTEETPKWFQVLLAIFWPLVLAIVIVGLIFGFTVEVIRLLFSIVERRFYRFTHRKEIARAKKLQEEAQEKQRKYQAMIQDQMKREQHADKYL